MCRLFHGDRIALLTGLLAIWLLAGAQAGAELPRPCFYLPLDGSTTAAISGGSPSPLHNATATGETDTIIELLSLNARRFVAGQVGQGFDLGDQPLVYDCAGNFRPDEGAVSLWFSPDWRGDNRQLYSTLFGASDWGMIYKYEDQTTLTFGTAKPTKDIYYDCGGGDLTSWRPGSWHHVAATWSRQANQRRLYVDGKLISTAAFPFHREVKSGPLFVGAGCTLYPNPIAHGKMDEFALWDRPLTEAEVAEARALGLAAKPLWSVPASAASPRPSLDTISVTHPATPPAPEPNAPQVTPSQTRTRVSLNGWWQFVPSDRELTALPAEGWGLSRVPGYWTTVGDTLGPDGKPVAQWAGHPLGRYWIGCYQRLFTAEEEWQGRTVRVHLGGVDGLAAIYLNGKLLGWLPGWQRQAYDITAGLNYGGENALTILLRTRGGSRIGGIYGDVGLEVTAGAVIDDVTVTPHVEAGRIEFSCGIFHAGPPLRGTLEFAVSAKQDPAQVVKRFSVPCDLTQPGTQRLSTGFDWPDAHLWNIDDPYLYQVTASLESLGAVIDRTEPQRFGFREFTMRGADFILNGKPVHLRGHQIDLAWGDQWPRVLELKAAGMNALELSGPITGEWYRGIPYHRKAFEDILDYCDTHGLIAAPILPDVPVIKERIFDPAVAELYRQRVESHIRQYGNHPCIGLWYMNFNLAGYLWYCAPSKIDGSYKPGDAWWQGKERIALEGQRIARSIDPRPIYHHACGNLGDIITSNLYLGPNSPTQEREEWPARWAEKRAKPFMACEHCCMLICYWFRPRQFPLSVVYAGEPIFDEISAMYLGPQAYAQITPQVFDLYDIGQPPRAGRTERLIANHPGYQATKSLVARQSLRAWRTYGVSGMFFNAENWDFKDERGQPLPMMKALARYFGDTDLYIAGPGKDWPSKDHAFVPSETVRKQVVLLNDLAHDIPCTLRWRLTDAAGKEQASGTIEAVSRAGTPSFYPIEFHAPYVPERTDFTLTVSPVAQPRQDFKPESFAIQVFPLRRPIAGSRSRARVGALSERDRSLPPGSDRTSEPPEVWLYESLGDTAQMLQNAGVKFTALTAGSSLTPEALLIVGRKSYDDGFLKLAQTLKLEEAVRAGLRVVVFEQTAGTPFGLKLEETSTRQSFIVQPRHPALGGLQAADFQDLRGQSDLLEPYPDAPPGSDRVWPARCFKWGNRGIVATYVYDKPQLSPFRPVLECGFDLAQSPLLEARFGQGSVTLCQVDVTPRYGTDPVATRLVENLLSGGPEPAPASAPCTCLGASAQKLLQRFGIAAAEWRPGASGVICVGSEAVSESQAAALAQGAQAGATVVLLAQAKPAAPLAPPLREERLFMGRLGDDPLLAGLSPSDLFLKSWETVPVVEARDGWQVLIEPGLLARKKIGQGQLIACRLDPAALHGQRAEAKALRVWSTLLSNLGVERAGSFLTAPPPAYEADQWERIPPYMSW